MTISILICSHNPNEAKFNLVIESLKKQDVHYSSWELVVIDNLSTVPIEQQYDFSWHPNVKVVSEPRLGISVARARSIVEASGELLIMVDDDAPLFPDYVRQSIAIAEKYPHIGCFGGNQLPITNIVPESKYEPYLEMIGFRVVKSPRISNMYRWDTTPAGAGMVIRASLAKHYSTTVFSRIKPTILGRKGESLMCSEDIDLAYHSIDQGYFNGVFPQLSIYHLTIEEHLNDDYLIRRRYHNLYSSYLLDFIRFKKIPPRIPRSVYWTKQLYRLLKGQTFQYTIKKMEYLANTTIRREISHGSIVY